MELSKVLLNVIDDVENVRALIEKTKRIRDLRPEVKFSYQAFCCALMAKGAKSNLHKIEYINSYVRYINSALELNQDCYEARLFRNSVEKELTGIDFANHIEQDSDFLKRNVDALNDEFLRKFTTQVLAS